MVDTKAPEKVAEAVKDGAPTTAATPAATTEIPAPATTLASEPSNRLLSAQHWAEIAPPVRPANCFFQDEGYTSTR